MPSPSYKELPISFEKGLVLSSEASVLEAGQVPTMQNWVPEHTGGFRNRVEWHTGSTTGLPTVITSRGIGILKAAQVASQVQASNTDTGTSGATLTFTATPTSGNMLIVMVSIRGTGTPTCTTPTNFTSYVTKSKTKGLVQIFYKQAQASEPSVITLTYTGATAARAVALEWKNLSAPDSTGTYDATATSHTLNSGLPSTASGYAFTAWAESTNAESEVALTDTSSFTSIYTNGTELIAMYKQFSSRAAVSQTMTSSSVNAIGAIAVFETTNLDAIQSKHLIALPASDGTETVSTTSRGPNSTNSDGTTIATSSTSPNNGVVVVVAVSSRKTASTPDIPTVSGTNAYSTTWTQRATVTSGNYRLTVFTGVTQSTTAGTITADFGGSNTQLTMAIQAFEVAAINTSSPYVQSATNSGTSTTPSVTLGAFAQTTNPTIFIVSNAGTAANIAPNSPFTEIDERSQSEGLSMSSSAASTNQTSPSATASNVAWLAIGMELASSVSATAYNVYSIAQDSIATGSWAAFDNSHGHSSNTEIVAFAQGAGSILYTSSGMSAARNVVISTGTGSNVSQLTYPGRCIAFHKSRFFCSGSLTNPYRVYFSDLASATSWPANNYFDVNGDDGEPVEEMVPAENVLLIGKTNSLWILSGSGIESFFLTRLPGGTCAKGRSMVSTPYGTIVAGPNDVWVVQGGTVDLISRPIATSYTITGTASTAFANDTVYICDSGSGTIWAMNLVSGAWRQESINDSNNSPYVISSAASQLLYAPLSGGALTGGLAYRNAYSSERLGDYVASSTLYYAYSPEMWFAGPNYEYTPRHLFLQTRSHGTGTSTLNVDIVYPTGTHTPAAITMSGASVERNRIDIGFLRGEPWVQVRFSQTASSAGPTIEVEKALLGVDVERIR